MNLRFLLTCAAFTVSSGLSHAADPAWWAARGVKTTSAASNLSPATIGQAKWMVSQALAEVEGKLPESVFLELKSDVEAIVPLGLPQNPGEFENQRKVLVLGQLKAISAPFYLKLHLVYPAWLEAQLAGNQTKDSSDPANFYPWTSNTADDNHMAIATLGQLKAVFSLGFESILTEELAADSDSDGIPDWWESYYGLDPNDAGDASGDLVSDGVSNLVKYKIGRNPLVVALPDSAGTLSLKVHTPLE